MAVTLTPAGTVSSVDSTTAQRNRRNIAIFGRFALVGASGVLVNLLVLVVAKKLGPDAQLVFLDMPLTRFNVRWYHVFSTLAFVVAVVWNFQLNRVWAFGSTGKASWWSEFRPFFAVGLLGQVVGLGLLTLLMHPGSPLALPTDLLDDSSGLRTRLYWGQLLVISAVTPLSFVLHKLWTFSAVRTHRLEDADKP
ncbi:GtrA family protein [Nocardioides jishulii]|uniref:GtrA family protein n=1 Tax=Nocardioides jishulii TaxID=2575440 RepID=A0A4U2YLX0_9ACTN|nr:GtrA family protein [Nocardioides jishulii]TKI61532.1 GtrA family protein [Nocardioides jishulii]